GGMSLGTQPRLGRCARNASESANPELWSGLVGAWVPSLGFQGTQLFDVSGYGNHGTLTNMDPATDWVVGEKGLALDFDGSNDYVNMGDLFDGLTQVTISAWGKWGSGTPSSNDAFVGKHNSFMIRPGNADNRIIFYIRDSVSWFNSGDSTSNINDGQWHHFVGKYDGNRVSIWMDGVEENASNVGAKTLNSNAENFQVGRLGSTNQYWNGSIDDVRIYNRALLPSEIVELYIDALSLFRLRQQVPMFVSAPPAGGLSIPVAMHGYRSRRVRVCG
ncbi:MAG: LamG domain-containing protein, partial [bacterium]